MKKILFISRYYLPKIGGIEQHIYKLSEKLKFKYQIEIFTARDENLPLEEHIGGVRVSRLNFFDFLCIDFSRHDVIFIENFNLFPNLFVASKLIFLSKINKKLPVVFFVPHGGFTPYWESFGFSQRFLKKSLNNTIGLYFLNHICNSVIAVSNWEKNELIKSGVTTEIFIIGNGFEPQQNKVKEKKDYFVFVGRIVQIKNIETILRTFRNIVSIEDFSKFKLYIIGEYSVEDSYYKGLLDLVLDLGIESKVFFLGKREGEEKMDLISSSRVLFCMSHFETDPIVVKEALSVGTKVVISPNFGLNDYRFNKNVFVADNEFIDRDNFIYFLQSKFFPTDFMISWDEVSAKYSDLISSR